MAGAWATLSVKDANGTSRTMRVWDESGTGAGPFSFASAIADLTGAGSPAVKAASTAAAATDESLVTNESPNSQLSTTAGVTTGAAVVTDANGTLQQYLRGLVKLLAALEGSASGGTAATSSQLGGGIYNSSAPTLTSGQQAAFQFDANGNLKTNIAAGSVAAKQDYQDFAASTASTAIKGQKGASGASGDWLDFIEIFPETTAAGAVTLQDGANTAVTIWAGGGTTALTSLVPFTVPVRANSANGAWKVTTGTNVHIRAVGNFT